MPNNLSDHTENLMLDFVNPDVALPTRPTSPLKVALFTVMPNQESGLGGTEVAGFAYARTEITFPLSSSSATSNTSAVNFPTATGGNWGEIPGIGIYDSAGTPVLLWTGTMNSPRTINDGGTFSIPSGALSFSMN